MRFLKPRILWRIHSILGLLAGIPLLIIAVTGSILVFKPELERIVMPSLAYSEPTAGGRLPYDVLREKVVGQLPGYVFLGWEMYDEPDRSDKITVVEVGTTGGLDAYLNPFTGEVKGTPKKEQARLMGWIRKLHYTFLADHTGMAITGVLAVLMMLLGLTGFLIYRKFWVSLFAFRWKTSLRVLSGNLHKRVGVISAPVVLILGLSGAWWNITHVWRVVQNGEVRSSIVGGTVGDDVSLDDLVARAYVDLSGFRTTFIRLPNAEGRPIVLFGEIEGQFALRSRYASIVAYDAMTGELRGVMPIGEAPFFDQLHDAFFPLHFGTFGGLFTRILYFVVGFAPAFLALSGTIVWFLRIRKKNLLRKQTAKPATDLPAEETADASHETVSAGR